MAISWITALKMVPWDMVVSNAPLVVDGARKLWNGTRKNEVETAEAEPGMTVEARLVSLESEVADLRQEMQSSAELIKALADQNAQLVQAVGVLRGRQRLLTIGVAVLAVAAIASGVALIAA